MHSFIVNAAIQLVPITQDRHPYDWVDEAIAIIQRSGITHEVGPFSTVLEGTYQQVTDVIHQVNEYLFEKGCPEWISNIQLQIRSGGPVTGEEKISKFR